MKLQQLFEHWLAATSTDKAFIQSLLTDKSEDLARLATLQDPHTGDTLLHIVLRQLETYKAVPSGYNDILKLNFCVGFAQKLLQDQDYASNVFLTNKAGRTPFDLMKSASTIWLLDDGDYAYVTGTLERNPANKAQATYVSNGSGKKDATDNSFIGAIPIYFIPQDAKKLINAHIADSDWHLFNAIAKGDVPEDVRTNRIVEMKYRYAHDLVTKEVSVLDLMAMNKQYISANALVQKHKRMQQGIIGDDTIDSAQGLLHEKLFNSSPLTQHTNLFLCWSHGNTHTVQTVFALEKRKLIREALGDNAELTDANMAQIYQNLIKLLFPKRANFSREILRRPLDRSDPRSWFSNDADTKSYKFILAVLQAFNPRLNYEDIWASQTEENTHLHTVALSYLPDNPGGTTKMTLTPDQLTALNQLATYAGLQTDYYSYEAVVEGINRNYPF